MRKTRLPKMQKAPGFYIAIYQAVLPELRTKRMRKILKSGKLPR